MNQSSCFGSLAVETACPNRNQKFLFRHSLSSTALATEDKNARVTARPPTRANQSRLHRSTAYIPNLGRDIGLRCYRFTMSLTISSRPTHENPNLPMRTNRYFVPSAPFAHPWPVRLALAHFSQTAGPDFPFHTFTKPLISRRETNFSS
jgi:hypothetical protein